VPDQLHQAERAPAEVQARVIWDGGVDNGNASCVEQGKRRAALASNRFFGYDSRVA